MSISRPIWIILLCFQKPWLKHGHESKMGSVQAWQILQWASPQLRIACLLDLTLWQWVSNLLLHYMVSHSRTQWYSLFISTDCSMLTSLSLFLSVSFATYGMQSVWWEGLKPTIMLKDHICITINSLSLNEDSSGMKDPDIIQLYVEYQFLGFCGQGLETPTTAMKPCSLENHLLYNFKKCKYICIYIPHPHPTRIAYTCRNICYDNV
jgi:hypothetical protein